MASKLVRRTSVLPTERSHVLFIWGWHPDSASVGHFVADSVPEVVRSGEEYGTSSAINLEDKPSKVLSHSGSSHFHSNILC